MISFTLTPKTYDKERHILNSTLLGYVILQSFKYVDNRYKLISDSRFIDETTEYFHGIDKIIDTLSDSSETPIEVKLNFEKNTVVIYATENGTFNIYKFEVMDLDELEDDEDILI